jgi:uncharacterized Tic20 family protein
MTDAPPPPPGSGPGYGAAGYQQGPVAQLSPQDERTWAMLSHLGSILAALVAMAFLGPLLVMLVQGPKSAFVRRHAVESLNFQLTLLIALAAATVLTIVTLGLGLLVVIPVGIVVAIVSLICIVRASLAANDGRNYRYPLTLRLVK